MLDKVELKEYLEGVFSKGKLKLDVDIKPFIFDQRLEIRLKEDRTICPRCFIDSNFFKKRYNSKYPDYTISFDIINKATYKTLLLDELKIDCNIPEEVARGIYDCLMFRKKISVSYVAEIFKGKRNYSGCFVDFDGCVFADKDFYKCIQNAKGALALHLEGMLEDGDPLPIPKYWGRNEEDKEEDEESYLVLIETEIKLEELRVK